MGLRRVEQLQHPNVHVVGDSAVIIGMLQLRRTPRSQSLQGLYLASRRMADRIGVRSWTHHYRNNNKMADGLANIAMDSQRSVQFAPSAGYEASFFPMDTVLNYLENDVNHWIFNSVAAADGDEQEVISMH
ncbi:hypothetical protein PHYSODRAFT_531831 [Phytophthora sojae]|uniref:RNase H type-1 domain-containing protein n=1 Tax=Phytophthora sojae (strain P6497) TaxID=1094619 RepID=G5ADW2_PHYSP|nr:hypothetical protein PHYSODRAFT_531831 [Phytophthora sojae]EGZ06364.1 hypothetical protein PHYSODRAFT_531831 [Phytophthora sojae]|eukprot:XP_009538261.1 hypothetical protein PHYSODRAFT_531831 [Phytophthora sojae]